jgi:hypothetical protein
MYCDYDTAPLHLPQSIRTSPPIKPNRANGITAHTIGQRLRSFGIVVEDKLLAGQDFSHTPALPQKPLFSERPKPKRNDGTPDHFIICVIEACVANEKEKKILVDQPHQRLFGHLP